MATTSTKSQEILKCAQGFIAAGGYNGFSYADIAEQVGIRKPSIHHYFPTKADLVRTLVRDYRQAVQDGITQINQNMDNAYHILRAYTQYWEVCIADGTAPICICALLASELPILPKDVAAEVQAYFQMLSAWLADVLRRGHEQGTLHIKGDPKAEAEIFMAAVHGAMISARTYTDPRMFATIIGPVLERLKAT